MSGLGFLEIEFRTGFLRGGERVMRATMREPTVADNMASQAAAKDPAKREIGLFASLLEISPAEIETLTMADYARVQDAYRDFLGDE